jgi:hypothetical protein
MAMIRDLFASGRIADLILLILAAEFTFLFWRARPGSRGAAAVELVFRLAPGACLLFALRAALTGQSWIWIAAWLTASLPLHIGDLLRRRG